MRFECPDACNPDRRFQVNKTKKAQFKRIHAELAAAHDQLAWQVAAAVRASEAEVEIGMQEPAAQSRLAGLNAAIVNLRSLAQEALALAKGGPFDGSAHQAQHGSVLPTARGMGGRRPGSLIVGNVRRKKDRI